MIVEILKSHQKIKKITILMISGCLRKMFSFSKEMLSSFYKSSQIFSSSFKRNLRNFLRIVLQIPNFRNFIDEVFCQRVFYHFKSFLVLLIEILIDVFLSKRSIIFKQNSVEANPVFDIIVHRLFERFYRFFESFFKITSGLFG